MAQAWAPRSESKGCPTLRALYCCERGTQVPFAPRWCNNYEEKRMVNNHIFEAQYVQPLDLHYSLIKASVRPSLRLH